MFFIFVNDMLQNEKYPSKVLQDAVEAIGSLPGVGSRSAVRLTLHLLRRPEESIHAFAAAVDRLATDVHYCRTCSMIADGDECSICADRSRDHSQICVVENVRDVMSIEATGQYHGVYHVLGGIISPINGVAPSDLTIASLVERVTRLAAPDSVTDGSVEVILALSGGVEGETTAFYIYRQLEGTGCRITSLARGLGFGDDLEYADSLTLGRSIVNRIVFEP